MIRKKRNKKKSMLQNYQMLLKDFHQHIFSLKNQLKKMIKVLIMWKKRIFQHRTRNLI